MTSKIVVVGATFGAHYARALSRPDAVATLSGIVGAGGERSRQLADEVDVPLLTLEELLKSGPDVDCAVVAVRGGVVGGPGDDITSALLTAGVSVLQELPSHSRDVARSVAAARRSGAAFALNPFYSHLPTMRRFISRARALADVGQLAHVQVRASRQTLHSALFVLDLILEGAPPRDVEVLPGNRKHFVRCMWGGTEVGFSVGASLDPKDPDNLAQPLMSFTLTHEDGELIVEDPHIDARWAPRPHYLSAGMHNPDAPSIVDLPPHRQLTAQEALTTLWPAGIDAALGQLMRKEGLVNQRTLAVLKLWETISAKLPPVVPVTARTPVDRTALLVGVR